MLHGIKKLDKYIFRRFMMTFFIALLLIIGVVIIFDISEKIDSFVSKQATLHAIIFDYYVNFIPYFMNMFSPLFVFIAVIFMTSRMAQNSEIIAILSGGISYRRMLAPYVVGAFVVASLSLVLNLFVIPKANVVRLDFEDKYVYHHAAAVDEVHYQIEPGTFFYAESFSSWNNTAYHITLEKIENNRLVRKLSAETAAWDSTAKGWKLQKYFEREYLPDGQDRIVTGAKKDTVIDFTVTDFYRNKKTVGSLPIKELNGLIETQRMRGDPSIMYSLIEKNNRYSLPFSAFILTIMGVCLSSRKKRGGMGWNIAIGIALAFTYILFMKFSEMFVYTGVMTPLVAIWLPNVVFTLITVYLYHLAPK